MSAKSVLSQWPYRVPQKGSSYRLHDPTSWSPLAAGREGRVGATEKAFFRDSVQQWRSPVLPSVPILCPPTMAVHRDFADYCTASRSLSFPKNSPLISLPSIEIYRADSGGAPGVVKHMNSKLVPA